MLQFVYSYRPLSRSRLLSEHLQCSYSFKLEHGAKVFLVNLKVNELGHVRLKLRLDCGTTRYQDFDYMHP
jgi:hypothetical protein